MARNPFADDSCSICGDAPHGPAYLRDGHAYVSNIDADAARRQARATGMADALFTR